MERMRVGRTVNRRLAVVALAVVIVSGSVVALVADPLASQPEPATVDATAESPGEFVLAALETTERQSYAASYASQHDDEEPRVTRMRVDRAHRRALKWEHRIPGGEPNAEWYWGECTSVARVSTDVVFWGGRYEHYPDPFADADVEPSDLEATVVERTDQRVVVRVTNTSAAMSLFTDRSNLREYIREEGIRGNLTVVWDADEGVLDRVEYVDSSRVNETHRETFRRTWEFREWGQVRVDRPGWAGYTHHEFLCDVTTFRT